MKGDFAELFERGDEAWICQAMRDAGVGVWSWDASSDKVRLSGAGCGLHGLASGAALSLRDWLMILHADDRRPVRLAIERALGGNGDFLGEYRVVLSCGNERWISIHVHGRLDDATDPGRLMVGVLLDITWRKRMEHELNGQQQALIHMARTSTLGELSAALVHELNQPLSATLCNAQAGQRFLAQASPDLDEIRAILGDIAIDNQRAGLVISRLKELFKKEEAAQQTFDINVLVEEVAQLLRSELVMNQVSLRLCLGSHLPMTKGDPVQVRQILFNLALNGIEAMASPSRDRRQLQICTDLQDAGMLQVHISDTGPGIAPHMLGKIFDSFFTDKPNGLGVGLSISRIIINAHGGRLWADNVPGGGAILHFTLPAFREGSP